jgi:predicted amidohydrolase
MSPSLTEWLAELGPPGPIALDQLTACFLRYVRRHASALREARSAGLDRSVAGWRATLADALRTVLRTSVCSLAHLESRTSLEILWTRLHASLPERRDIASVLVARVCAEALDEAVGHRFVVGFRERRQWHVAPGDPFPIGEPALRDVFGRHLTTHPDVRDLAIDRTLRLALAPDAEGVELVLDLDGGLQVPDANATIAVCLPIGQPMAELAWDTDPVRGHFFGVRPRDPAAVGAAVRTLLSEALSAEAAFVVFPELSVDGAALADVARAVAEVSHRPLVVAGSRHAAADGAERNRATVFVGDAHFTADKFNPFVLGDMVEGIVTAPARLSMRGAVDGNGRFAWSVAVLICKDFLSPGAHQLLIAARPSLVVVPAMTERTAVFETDAIGLTGATQCTCIVVNQVDPRGADREDAAVAIVSRPVPWALTEIVRRSEVTPPVCLLLSLRPDPP